MELLMTIRKEEIESLDALAQLVREDAAEKIAEATAKIQRLDEFAVMLELAESRGEPNNEPC